MFEEGMLRHQARHRDQLPAGGLVQSGAGAFEIGNALRHVERLEAVDEDIASTPGNELGLTLIQAPPQGMLLRCIGIPLLGDHIILVGMRIVAAQGAAIGFGGDTGEKILGTDFAVHDHCSFEKLDENIMRRFTARIVHLRYPA